MLDLDQSKLENAWLDDAERRFGAVNDDLVPRTRSLLGRIVEDAALHPRLINTLSLLEHMGSHKIMSTQHAAGIDQATLKHLAEEAQHAWFMKRHAEKAAGRPLEYIDDALLAPASARMYFQRLEAGMVRLLARQRSVRAAYLYMSMIVEFRALWFYGLYQHALKRAGNAMSLKRLLGEERSHLGDMAERLDIAGELSDARVDEFVTEERRLYVRMLDAIERAAAPVTASDRSVPAEL